MDLKSWKEKILINYYQRDGHVIELENRKMTVGEIPRPPVGGLGMTGGEVSYATPLVLVV